MNTNNKERYSNEMATETMQYEPKDITELENGFFALKNENGYLLAFCNQIVSSKKYESIEAIKADLRKKPWNIILMATQAYIERINKMKQEAFK